MQEATFQTSIEAHFPVSNWQDWVAPLPIHRQTNRRGWYHTQGGWTMITYFLCLTSLWLDIHKWITPQPFYHDSTNEEMLATASGDEGLSVGMGSLHQRERMTRVIW